MINEFKCFWYVDGTHDDWPMTIEADGLDLKSITIPVQYENGESEVLRFVPERTCHIVKTWTDSDYAEHWRYSCSECGYPIEVGERDIATGDPVSHANFCWNCGRRVVDE